MAAMAARLAQIMAALVVAVLLGRTEQGQMRL